MKPILLLFIVFIPLGYCNAQSLSPTVVAAQGDYFWSPTVSVAWTIGEVFSETYSSSDHILTQGFHQPDLRSPNVSEGSFLFFNGFSPNGDGINDWWKIPVLNDYPINTVVIINRWGGEVWKKDNYDNKNIVFKGENMNGNDLPDGTYYYIIQYNKTEKRGWVYIKR
jgi:gliding motility-associated-like protein